MQCFVFLLTLLALFSATLASPLPLRAIQEAREPVAELIVLGVPMNNQILDREATTDTESDVSLHILAREHKSFEEYVQEMTGGKKIASDPQDMEPRECRFHLCQ